MSDDGVPLSHWLTHPNCGIRITCVGCMKSRDVPIQPVIDGLKARGVGDEKTGIRAVAGFLRSPCPRCGATRYGTSPAWGTTPKG